jgi:CHRD domain-containing protein
MNFVFIVIFILVTTTMIFAKYESIYAELRYLTDLSGFSEVPQIFSEAGGNASIRGNETILEYEINVTGLENATMASISEGEETENGPVLAILFNSTVPSKLTHGVLARGTITNSSLLGPIEGKSLTDLVELINENRTYININTTRFSQGELRGNIISINNSNIS